MLLLKRVLVVLVATFLSRFVKWQYGLLSLLYGLAVWLQSRWTNVNARTAASVAH